MATRPSETTMDLVRKDLPTMDARRCSSFNPILYDTSRRSCKMYGRKVLRIGYCLLVKGEGEGESEEGEGWKDGSTIDSG